VFFLEPNQTPYDLHWRMFGISIRVHPMFWLITVIMGFSKTERGLEYLLVWVGCVFISILVHELGHVWMGQVFGSDGHIVLYGFGGLAIGSNQLRERWQRIAVCFAGPLAGFLFLGILLAVLWISKPEVFPVYWGMTKSLLGLPGQDSEEFFVALAHFRLVNPLVGEAALDLIFINLLWGLVNLLPVWPLDGGQISRDICEGASRDRGLAISLGISLAVAALLAVHSLFAINGKQLLPLSFGDRYTALLFGLLALQSFQMLQQAHAQRRWMDDHWQRRDW
jgi:Zn-dependent protease